MNCQDRYHRGTDPQQLARRWFLRDCGMGLGAMALGQLLGGTGRAADSAGGLLNPLAPRQPHFTGRAKRGVFLFMAVGPGRVGTVPNKAPIAQVARPPRAPPSPYTVSVAALYLNAS